MADRTKEYPLREPIWRIEAVIHDGSWYDVKKWARVAKVQPEDIESWIRDNRQEVGLIKLEESYRVNYDEIIRWYSKQTDIDITDKIIPKNYPPRLWGGKTEVETFIAAKRRTTSTLTFTTDDEKMVQTCTRALAGIAKVSYEDVNTYKAYGLSDTYMEKALEKVLTTKEIKSLNIKKRKGLKHRELSDFSPEFIEQALLFYIDFASSILRSKESTLKIYLPDKGAIRSQIIEWIIKAMRKFDETQPVPFSGYLNSVLRFWPYDLPDNYLGKELSSFQRNKKKAIDRIHKRENNNRQLSSAEIVEEMKIDFNDYVRLSGEHETWLAERNASELNWTDSANEKAGTMVGVSKRPRRDVPLASKISSAILDTILITADLDSGMYLITAMGEVMDNAIEKKLSTLKPAFTSVLARELVKRNGLHE